MQDEPEAGECFQHKMSLKRELGIGCILLVDGHPHAERRAVDPDREAGVCRGEPCSPIARLILGLENAKGSSRLPRAAPAPTRI